MSAQLRIRTAGVGTFAPGTRVDIAGTDWVVESTEPDPYAVWSFTDWSEKIDGTGWEGSPSSRILVLVPA